MTAALLLAALLGQPLPPQATGLGQLADACRDAFRRRDYAALFDARQPVRLELPNQPASVSVRGRVAAASLAALVRRTEDLAIEGTGAAVVADGHGYIELRRVFRTLGTQERRFQRILLSARFGDGRWRVTELWVAPAVPGRS